MVDELERAIRQRDLGLLAEPRSRGVQPRKPGLLDLPGGVTERLALLNQFLNPVEAIGQSMQAGERMVQPNMGGYDRLAALGDMLSGVAGVAGPAVAAGRAGLPAATAIIEGLLGSSPTTQAAGDMARQFGVDEYGGVDLNRFPFYHGTPDARDVRSAGGFAANKPVFLSDNPNVARTYADPRRAWDYQGAEPEVFRAMTSPERVLDIDAKGADFRGISVDAVKSGLIKAGIPESEVSARISAAAARRNDNRISTNDLIDIVRGLGFDAADIANVRDTYNATAKAPKSTVRMMFNPSQINIPNLLGSPQ